MKRIILSLGLVMLTLSAWSQENSFTLSGGYAFANIEDIDADATGYRINGLYEFTPAQGKFVHGISFGYIHTKATASTIGTSTTTVKLNTFPIYYAPKFMFGGEKLKGFVKGALGMHLSSYNIDGALISDENTTDFGFYGGAGLGALYNVSDKLFLNLEYEWAYLSNSWYVDGFMNTAQIGVGIRF